MQPLSFRNDASQTAPGFGVMRCVGSMIVAGRMILRMERPGDMFERRYYVNGPTPVEPGHYGECFLLDEGSCLEMPVRHDTEGPAPSHGESWGATAHHWHLSRGYPGFTILGGAAHGRVFARSHEVTLLRGTLANDLSTGNHVLLNIRGTDLDTGSGFSTGLRVSVGLVLAGSDYLEAGWQVFAGWADGEWKVISAADCPTVGGV